MKRGEIAPEEQFLLLSTIFCYLMLDFYVKIRIRFSLQDKWLFEITEVEIKRVNCTLIYVFLNSCCKFKVIGSKLIWSCYKENNKAYMNLETHTLKYSTLFIVQYLGSIESNMTDGEFGLILRIIAITT